MPSEQKSSAKPSRTSTRKNTATAMDNYYKILGVRINATPHSIKQGYVAKIKEFPPEQFPEEFQTIRSAYEVLRDPVKRSDYDFIRKYGDSVDTLLKKGAEADQVGDDITAEACFRKVLDLSPDHIGAIASLARVYLSRDQMKPFETQWVRLMETTNNELEYISASLLKCDLLLEFDKEKQALQHMQKLDKHYRQHRKLYIFHLAHTLDLNGKDAEGWRLIEETVPDVQKQQPDDLGFFIQWVLSMIDLEKRQYWSKIKQRFRVFLRSLTNPEDITSAVETLLEESQRFLDGQNFKEAQIFVDLAYYLDPRNPEVSAQLQFTREGVSLMKEIDRLMRDSQIHPGISAKVISFFAKDSGVHDFDDIEESFLPLDMLQEMSLPADFMLSGIKLLQRKYPLIYKRYQEQWEQLAQDNSAGLNREARRRLR